MGLYTPDAPPPRDYASETAATLKAQVDLRPEQEAAEDKYGPQAAARELRIAGQTLPGYLDLADKTAVSQGDIERRSRRQQTAGDVGLLEEFGGQYRHAIESANPDRTALQGMIFADARKRFDEPMSSMDRHRFQTDYRDSSRGRFSNTGPSGAAAEAFYMADRGREFAEQGRTNAYRAIGLDQQLYGDSWLALTGRNSGVNPQGYMNSANRFNPGNLFNPESGYAGDIYNTNYNAKAAANIAGAGNMAGLLGAGIGAAGAVAGGFARCWVAREVFGEGNPEWRQFRTWLLTLAPQCFHDLYMAHGERFAEWIKDKPKLKSIIRWWMRRRIASLNQLEARHAL